MLQCLYCRRKIGLWNYKQKPVDEPVHDEDLKLANNKHNCNIDSLTSTKCVENGQGDPPSNVQSEHSQTREDQHESEEPRTKKLKLVSYRHYQTYIPANTTGS